MVKEEGIDKLGLKCGLEIHQQLATGKLFCRCPSVIEEDAPDFEVVRYLRASAGETGEVDRAAAHEQVKAKRFRYYGYKDTTCLVELDEEPPHPMNDKAVVAALQLAKLVDATILDTVHVMRKTVVDGSNTSGFQRTALVAIGGVLPESKVGVQTLCLEEDACKIVERKADEDVYNLSRLGIPLVELATDPDITTPDMAKDVAAEIGMLLRSTGACKRGLGTIRQDLNVSIKGGTRVEIKGAQDLKMLPTLTENEARRQEGLLKMKKELQQRGLTEIFLPPPHDMTMLVKGVKGFVGSGISKGQALIGIVIPRFGGLFGTELFPGYRLGTEIAGYAKVMGFGGLIHSDEKLDKYKLTKGMITAIKRKLKVQKDDAFILLLGEKTRIEECFAFLIIPRLEKLLHGVPGEVRKANADGTSTFLRPMPGAARMYPETDIPRVQTDAASVVVPKPLKEQEQNLVKKYKIQQEHAKEILREGIAFDTYVKQFPKLNPAFIASSMLVTPKEIKKRYKKEFNLELHDAELKAILTKVNEKAIPAEAVMELMVQVADGHEPNFSKYAAVDDKEVEKVVKAVIKADPKAPVNALMGQAMAKLRGKASGKTVMALLKKHTKKK
ncbi:Glu-tRNA(Gln) amidotransferase subunit GatE [Candidatus Woesearchaeota archaeon]|nr:Glu-tRNA(Gln) amidotransferase subunit GatE [Candidatus Woesearchaeota archaeon]